MEKQPRNKKASNSIVECLFNSKFNSKKRSKSSLISDWQLIKKTIFPDVNNQLNDGSILADDIWRQIEFLLKNILERTRSDFDINFNVNLINDAYELGYMTLDERSLCHEVRMSRNKNQHPEQINAKKIKYAGIAKQQLENLIIKLTNTLSLRINGTKIK